MTEVSSSVYATPIIHDLFSDGHKEIIVPSFVHYLEVNISHACLHDSIKLLSTQGTLITGSGTSAVGLCRADAYG